jgi:cytochrome c
MTYANVAGWMITAAIALGAAAPARAADPAAGAIVFKAQCSACHSPAAGRNLVGPSLFGVIGRKSGSVEGFHYSAANKAAGVTWDEAKLDPYLTSPKTVVPGTIMTYAGLKDAGKRADLIAYLATLH